MKRVFPIAIALFCGILAISLVGCSPVKPNAEELAGSWTLNVERSVDLVGTLAAPGSIQLNADGTGSIDGLSMRIFALGMDGKFFARNQLKWQIEKSEFDLDNDRVQLEIALAEGSLQTSLDLERRDGAAVIYNIVNPDKPTVARFERSATSSGKA